VQAGQHIVLVIRAIHTFIIMLKRSAAHFHCVDKHYANTDALTVVSVL